MIKSYFYEEDERGNEILINDITDKYNIHYDDIRLNYSKMYLEYLRVRMIFKLNILQIIVKRWVNLSIC